LGIQIIPDNWPQETSWSITDPVNNIVLAQGTSTGDTICVPVNSCVLVEISTLMVMESILQVDIGLVGTAR
jgi:hypothetical protein